MKTLFTTALQKLFHHGVVLAVAVALMAPAVSKVAAQEVVPGVTFSPIGALPVPAGSSLDRYATNDDVWIAEFNYHLAFVALLPGEYVNDALNHKGQQDSTFPRTNGDSIYLVVSGNLRVRSDSEAYDLGPNDMLFKSSNESSNRTFRNETDQCVKLVVVGFVHPGGGGGFYEPESGPMKIAGEPCGYVEDWGQGTIARPDVLAAVGLSYIEMAPASSLSVSPMAGGASMFVNTGSVTVANLAGEASGVAHEIINTPIGFDGIITAGSEGATILTIQLLAPGESVTNLPCPSEYQNKLGIGCGH